MPRRNRGRSARGRDQRWGSPRKPQPDWELDEPRERRERFRRPGANVDPPLEIAYEAAARAVPVALVCGNCLEWFPHEVGGRGDCGHPGSGFVAPWSDTPACPFFAARR